MPALFAFDGRIGRGAYAAWSLGVFAAQHLAVLAVFLVLARPTSPDWFFYVMPLRALAYLGSPSEAMLASLGYLEVVAWTIAAWMLAALAFRRTADSGMSAWLAASVIAPIVQIPVIAILCLAPPREPRHSGAPDRSVGAASGWSTAAQGMLAGIALTLFAVAAGALVFGTYGIGMFVVSPFAIGATTGYFANRHQDVGSSRTIRLVLGATALGGLALVAVALEGIICIFLAAPLAGSVAAVGGLFGRAVARYRRGSRRTTLTAYALLPIVFASENLFPTTTSFETLQTIEVAAPPEAVWQAILHMDPIDKPPGLPFRLGVAYPIRGDVVTEGVGGVRRGEFSTGIALEEITEWLPERRLAFVVVSDVPAMRELSPYEHVHSPHVAGYFKTGLTRFELVPRRNGRTEVIERTFHELKLDPVLYWLPFAAWIVDQNNARVLEHIRDQAERQFLARP